MEEFVRQSQLEKIRHFLKMGYYDSVVKESCAVLEEVLKQVYRKAVAELPVKDRTALLEAETAIGRGVKGYTEFGFGQLVAVFSKSRLLDVWAKHTGAKLGMLKSISLDYIVELRNQLTHNGSAQQCARNEASLVYECLMSWLDFIGYQESKTAAEEPEQSVPAFAGKADARTKQTSVQKHIDYLQQKTVSSYHSDKASEVRRLKIQSRFSEESDHESFLYALQRIGHKEHLCGLDVGCADGYVTESRFRSEYGFELVVGIDHNEKMIARQSDHDIFRYRHINVESPDFEDEMDELLDEFGIEGFDVIFMALTLHHLKQPVRFLRKIRRYLNKGGALILRGVDDGALIAYGDDGLVEKVIEESIDTKNMSDRFHARKFYSMLRTAGFDDIKMNYAEADSVGIDAEEKDVLFRYYFKFRSDYTKRQLDSDPDNPEYRRKHEQMCEDLESLQDVFLKPDFYFMVLTISAIAIR